MVKIGDFARMGRVSIKALRHYDDIGLLRPVRVDSRTGYRYYSASQLPLLNRLLVYKNLGFSLEQTSVLLRRNSSPEELRELLRARQTELTRRIEVESVQLADVVSRIQQIELEGDRPRYDVLLKEVESREVLSIRKILPDYQALEPLLNSMSAGLPASEVDGYGAIWHQCLFSGAEIDCEALVFLKDARNVCRLPAARVASVIYNDRDEDPFPHVYRAVLEQIHSSGDEIQWPMREIYYSDGGSRFDVTEVQFPIRPKESPVDVQ
jgi:DNA-binding transcriptional MerR regulator